MWSYIQRRQIAKEIEGKLTTINRSRLEEGKPSHLPAETLSDPASRTRSIDQAGDAEQGSSDIILVRSLGDNDPLDPQNWPLISRTKNIWIVCFLVFVQGWAGAAESMSNSAVSREFHVSRVAENLSTALYLFGVGTGALFAGPVSETVGRNPTYLIGTFCYLCFVLGSALTPTFGGQIVCRFFVGLSASATLSINGASVNDQFRPVKRAFVFPIVAWANVSAPVIAPIAGGWITSNPSLSWRWTEWVTLIISAAAFLIALLFLPETYFPILLDWKAKELRRITGDTRYRAEHAQSTLQDRLRTSLPLPAKFFRTEPVILVLGLYLVLLYTLLFTFLSGFDYIFKETYQLSTGFEGSCFASIALGTTVFALLTPALYILARWRTEYRRGAIIKPEFRLWPAIVTSPLLPVSLFWLGWSNYPTVSIWSGLGACFVFGMVLSAVYVSSYEYITDSYQDHAAIALASITAARYLIAGGMVLAARPMYEGIGVHWTMTLLGCVAVVLTPAPFLFWLYGPKLRLKSPWATSLDDGE